MNNARWIFTALLLLSSTGCAWQVTGECRDCFGLHGEYAEGVGCGYDEAVANAQQQCSPGKTFYPETDTFLFQFCGALGSSSSAWIAKTGEVTRDLWWMNRRPGSAAATGQGEGSCPTGQPVKVTVKIENFIQCEDPTLYYYIRWQDANGPQEVGPIAVAFGETGSMVVEAWDSDNDGDNAADVFAVSWSGFNPDPALGCGSADIGLDGVLLDGDTLTFNVQADVATYTQTITHAAPDAPPGSGASAPRQRQAAAPQPLRQRELKPIPDPRFASRGAQ